MRTNKSSGCPHVSSSVCESQLATPEELSAYIDKELPAWKRHLIRRHLKKCSACATQVQQLQRTDNFLRRAGAVEVSDAFLGGVMARVSGATQHASLWSRTVRSVAASFGWVRHGSLLADKLRHTIQTRSPVYIFILTFGVFTMVGVTLYPPPSDRFGQPVHAWKKSQELGGERLISFEVIRREPPKRLLTNYLQRK